jgi:hypothetical protein
LDPRLKPPYIRNLIKKLIITKKKKIRLKNEVVIPGIVFKMVYRQPYKGFPKKSPIYQFRLLITEICLFVLPIPLYCTLGTVGKSLMSRDPRQGFSSPIL